MPHPARRLKVIRRLSEAGIPVRVMASPMVPGLTDHELETILKAGRDAGAIAASWIMLRLPREVAPLFRDWLEERFPGRAAHVMGRVRELHGGRDYDPDWGKRMTGEGLFAEMMKRRFDVAVKRLGLAKGLRRCAAIFSACRRGPATSCRCSEGASLSRSRKGGLPPMDSGPYRLVFQPGIGLRIVVRRGPFARDSHRRGCDHDLVP